MGREEVVPHLLNSFPPKAQNGSLHPHILSSISMGYFNNNAGFYPTIPVVEDFDACLGFNLALAIEAADIPGMQPKSSSLANWDGSLDAGAASEPAILAPAPSCGNNPLCPTPLRTRMLTDREQLPSPPGVTTRARKTPSHPSR